MNIEGQAALVTGAGSRVGLEALDGDRGVSIAPR